MVNLKKIMLKKGYIINDNYNLKYSTIRSINDKKAVRMYRLEKNDTPEYISKKVNEKGYSLTQKQNTIEKLLQDYCTK